MTAKRFTETLSTGIVTDNVTGKEYKCEMRIDDELLEFLNELAEENNELKQEVELLREGLNTYDENLPLYLTCKEIRDFNSDLFEFKIKQQKFYNKHPRLCKIIVDGKELEE